MAELIQKQDTLNEGRVKLNEGIKASERAEGKSDQAVSTAQQAVNTASTAETKADSVQQQFNNVVIEGDSSVEAAQARVKEDGSTFDTLRDRLNSSDSQLAQTAERSPTASKANIEYFVSPNGNDENEGTSTMPFRTLSKILSMLPDMIRKNHVYTINLDIGAWDEELNLEHIIIYGQLIVRGTTNNRENHKVYRVTGESLIGHTVIENITTTVKDGRGQSFRFRRSTPHVELGNIKAESDPNVEKGVEGVIGLLADHGSQVYVRNFECSGKRYAMRSNYLSRIFSIDNTGSGNTFGVGARWGGIVTMHGEQPSGDTNVTTSSGGIATYRHGGKLGLPEELGLVDIKSENDRPASVKRYFITQPTLGLSGDIPTGKQFRLRFQAVQYGHTDFYVKFRTQTSSTWSIGFDCIFSGVLDETSYSGSEKTSSFLRNLTTENSFNIEHRGSNGEIDIVISSGSTSGHLAGRWSIDIESKLSRAFESPKLISVELENV